MEIRNEQSGNQGTFFIEEAGSVVAEMTYSIAQDGTMTIDHTEVDKKLRGKNVGSELVGEAVEFARAKNIKIVPQCSFARSVFEKESAFSDVLHQ